MSDENVGGLVELLPCPFCGSQPKLETHSQYHSYSAREAQQDGMGYSAGGFSTTSWSVDCACGISVPGNNDAFLVQRWNTRALSAHGQPVVDAAMIERALSARFRRFSVRQLMQLRDGADEEVMRAALTAALGGNDRG